MRALRTLLIFTATFITATGAAFADAPRVDKCLFCHDPSNQRRLTGKGADNIAAKMQEIRAGERKHPTALTDLSDEEIAAMAAALDAGI